MPASGPSSPLRAPVEPGPAGALLPRRRPAGEAEAAPFHSYALDRAGAPRFHIRRVADAQSLYPAHRHDYFQLLYFQSDAPPQRIGLTLRTPAPGSIYFIGPMVPHQVRFDLATRCVVIYFDLDFLRPGTPRTYPLAELVRASPELTPFALQDLADIRLDGEERAAMEATVETLIAQNALGDPYAREIVRAELSLCLARICQRRADEFAALWRRMPAPGRDGAHMRAISDFIGENYVRGPSLEEAARAARLSRSRFCALVRRYTGATFNALVREMRIEEARERLVLTSDSITQIAYAVGYNDEKYFLRAFKTTVGMTPGAYRSAHGGSGGRSRGRDAGVAG